MSNTNDLLNRINAKYSTMSKGHKLLATYITDNYDKAPCCLFFYHYTTFSQQFHFTFPKKRV